MGTPALPVPAVLLAALLQLAALFPLPAATTSGEAAEPGRRAVLEPPQLLDRRDLRSGDLPDMSRHRRVRFLVLYGRSDFFIPPGAPPQGRMYELGREYVRRLNRASRRGTPPLRATFVPVLPDELLSMLRNGAGDVVAHELRVTPEREAQVAFTVPLRSDVRDILVTAPGVPGPVGLEGLSGREIFVLPGSSGAAAVARLNLIFLRHGLDPARIREAPATMGTEDLLEMLGAGIIDNAVCEDSLAELWGPVFGRLTLHSDLPLTAGGRTAWAVRRDNPRLLASLNRFLMSPAAHEVSGGACFAGSCRGARILLNPFRMRGAGHLLPLFRKYSQIYGFDWLEALAQGFQESGLDPGARSPDGALGVMQVLPSTGRAVGVPDVSRTAGNIQAGLKYMRRLQARYLDDPALDEEERFRFALAAYNAGPSRIQDLRDQARLEGLNPNVWFGSVERLALRRLGPETVNYVRAVHNTAQAFRLALEREREGPVRGKPAGEVRERKTGKDRDGDGRAQAPRGGNARGKRAAGPAGRD